ncbi:vesicle docking protein [Rattus norvegicus]|uniref:General vesicular transport factor p115 n=2 Tax=Rattus norvegicus TaxID=10116 RepID=USO1_RAT|nr:general vesicular transport factor p115 [Rattus norvegicus]P41542.1 RecName: Full=General vesicular transport factor p115; AltName: Full=Protein USO1 homolog; AltName: Full=Transcytosis-associated protein; Short=TAP; AltName: Full=Vesicle-docking protein [Rattus norvegicus]AAA62632.1 p115 [Rattus norvegicus]EDL88606.1 vesicle docking protein [Rattus norvegicus]
MNFLRGVMGGQSAGPQHTEAETIQKLCDRVASSTLLDDRRNAVRALKSLSKKYRLEVGIQAMEHLIHVLQTDRSDSEIIAYALDTLYNIISNDEEEEVEENSTRQSEDLGSQFTEIFIKQPENVTLLLSLLEEFDFHVRWPGVRLLTSLLKQLGPPVQQIILVSPMGVSKLMDLLADSREIIRNDGVLLLQALTRSNGAIQKIVAFENAFERLLDIITEEGNSDGGIVVEDCLILLQNLLKNNNSNQNFFKEGSYIQRMKAWFEVGDENPGWSAQKVTNLHLMLQLVRVLVSPTNPPGATSSCQKAMFQCGLLQQLCTILMATGIPADILTETINTVSEVIRGCQVNQDYFASVNAPSNPPRPAIVVLLMSMVNERQPFVLRCAVLYCFQCFLYKNEKGQGEIVATLLPSTIDATGNSVSAGQLLCGGLFSTDSLSNWCAAVALAHALQGNATQKEQLLRVQLATSIGNPPVSLLQQCTNILSQGSKIQTRVGLLMLLCTWLSNCPIAVTHFLHNSANVPFLTGQIAENLGEEEQLVQGLCALLLGISIYFNDNSLENYTKEKLKQLIEKRIGKENYIEKLGFISKHELYSRASQKPQPNFPSPEYMIFDHEFTKLVKELEGVITKAIYKSSEEDKKEEEVKKTLEQHDNIVTHYKNMIREQDLQLEELKQQVSTLKCQNEQLQTAVTQQASQIQQHKDQYNLLKVQLGKDNHHQGSHSDGAQVNGIQPEEISRLREEIEELRSHQVLLQSQLAEKDTVIENLRSSQVSGMSEQALATCSPRDAEQVAELKQELSALKSQLCSQSLEITRLQTENSELQQRAETLAKSVPVEGESELVTAAKTTDVEGRLSALLQETKELKNEIKALSEERTAIQKQLDSSNSTIAILQTEKDKLYLEVTDSKKEQDDLLVLLADQDQKILSLKSKLKDLGHPVEEEDESGDQEDDDDELDDGDRDQDI